MDILSARKKAAAGKKGKNSAQEPEQQVSEPVMPAEPDPAPEQAAPSPSAPEIPSALQAGVEASAQQEKRGEGAGSERVQAEIELLAFRIGSESYAVPVEETREVLKLCETTVVPHTPGHVLGVMLLRGAVLPVIDLSRRLGLGAGDRGESARVVVVSVENEEAGLLVDRVAGVVRVRSGEIRPAPETAGQGAEAELVRGIARKDNVLHILLDLEKVIG